ncbi:MAG TPA: hypothetical protein VH020_09220 [Stellaceae bacterium]|nr:hypothetical protein [Stellaceae bacterium]
MIGRDWQVGERVVCIDATPHKFDPPGWRFYDDLNGLAEGAVYTIREILINRGLLCIRLREIYRPSGGVVWNGGEWAYYVARFRRIQPNTKSIEALRQLVLRPDPALGEPVHEDAQ